MHHPLLHVGLINSTLTCRAVFVFTQFWFLCDRSTAAKRRGVICVTGTFGSLFFPLSHINTPWRVIMSGGAVTQFGKKQLSVFCNTFLPLTAVGERR